MLLSNYNAQKAQRNNRYVSDSSDSDGKGGGGGVPIPGLRAILKAVPFHTSSKDQVHSKYLHIRPLYTAGDLMLAILELMDPLLFEKAVIQIIGELSSKAKDRSWSDEIHYLRVIYRKNKPNKWFYFQLKYKNYNFYLLFINGCCRPHFQLRDTDLIPFLCPRICPEVEFAIC
jgi:hypothetical protein